MIFFIFFFVCVYEFLLIIGKKIYSERTNNFPGVITYSVFSRCLKKLSCLKPSSDWSPCSPSIATDLLLITVNLSMRSISTNNLSKEEGFLCHPTTHRISTPKGYSFCIPEALWKCVTFLRLCSHHYKILAKWKSSFSCRTSHRLFIATAKPREKKNRLEAFLKTLE